MSLPHFDPSVLDASKNMSVAIVVLLLALSLDLLHSLQRSGSVASLTEDLGKWLVASTLAFGAANVLSPDQRIENMVLLVVAIAAVLAIFAQAGIYQRQREQTRRHLRELAASKRKDCNQDPYNITGEILAELVDADFVPVSWGNTISHQKRKTTRHLAARWLTHVYGVEVRDDELLVPTEKRHGKRLYQVLGGFVFALAVTYILLLVFSDPASEPQAGEDAASIEKIVPHGDD